MKKTDTVTKFEINSIKSDMGLTIDEFIDLCILCGCDYCTTIPKIGYNRAYNHITTYRNIDKMIESGKFTIPDEFINKYTSARSLFNIYKNTININTIPIVNSEYNEDILREYLLNNCNMNKTKANNALKKIKPI